jgi:hypothetical protein
MTGETLILLSGLTDKNPSVGWHDSRAATSFETISEGLPYNRSFPAWCPDTSPEPDCHKKHQVPRAGAKQAAIDALSARQGQIREVDIGACVR